MFSVKPESKTLCEHSCSNFGCVGDLYFNMIRIQSCRLMEVSSQDKLDLQAVACLLVNVDAIIVLVVRGKYCYRYFRLEPIWIFGN